MNLNLFKSLVTRNSSYKEYLRCWTYRLLRQCVYLHVKGGSVTSENNSTKINNEIFIDE